MATYVVPLQVSQVLTVTAGNAGDGPSADKLQEREEEREEESEEEREEEGQESQWKGQPQRLTRARGRKYSHGSSRFLGAHGGQQSPSIKETAGSETEPRYSSLTKV